MAKESLLTQQPERECYHLSQQQTRLWQLAQTRRVHPYWAEAVVDVIGPVDAEKLARAWQGVVWRHEILRTDFHPAEGAGRSSAVQSVLEPEPAASIRVGSSASGPAELQLNAQACPSAGGPLWQLRFAPGSEPDTPSLQLRLASLVCDADSLLTLLRELVQSLEENADGGEAAVASPSPLQYADYAQWQRELIASEVPEPQGLRTSIDGAALSLRLPFERQSSHRWEEFEPETIRLNRRTIRPLEEAARRSGLTVPALLFSAWGALLWRYLDRPQRLILGWEDQNRRQSETRGAVGPYAKVLPVLVQMAEGRPLWTNRDLLELIRRAEQEVESDAWGPVDQSTPRFIPFQFAYQERPRDIQSDRLQFHVQQFCVCIEPCRASLRTTLLGDELILELVYDRQAIRHEEMALLGRCLDSVLDDLLMEPDRRPEELELLHRFDRNRVLDSFSSYDPQPSPMPFDPVHERIFGMIRKRPSAPAVVQGDDSISYETLGLLAGSVARSLRQTGVGRSTPVAVGADRSLRTVAAILGILRAGGAYVPIDPSYPDERVRHCVEETQAPVVVVHRRSWRFADASWATLDLDEIAPGTRFDESAELKAEDPAYIIYTSGSTGRPKGVCVSHGNLSHAQAARNAYYPEPPGAFLMVSSFSFDSSVAGTFWTLSAGGTLVLPRDGEHQDPQALVRLIERHCVSHLLMLPSLYGHLLEAAKPSQLSSLKTVIMAGESCPAGLVHRHRAALPEAAFYNEYGPTEATVWSTVYRADPGAEPDLVPIGRPIPGTRLFVLDANGRPVPPWVTGEIYIAGPGVVSGYFKRPELTAERFVQIPELDPGTLYRTGDRARFRSDGQIEFLGRTDQQVKVRGYRVEPEEVAAVLALHPGVRDALVVAQDDANHDTRLLAYAIPEAPAPTTEELRDHLRKALPAYMVPARVMLLEKWPTTPNGKIDRQALPEPQPEGRPGGRKPAFGSETEEQLARIWAQFLKIPQVGPDESFFDLGGHSLIAIQIVSRIRESFRVELAVPEFFETPTVSALARRIEGLHRTEAAGGGLGKIPRVPRGG